MNAISSPADLPNSSEASPLVRTLAAGDYLVELALAERRVTTPKALEEGMARLGFSEACVDTAPRQTTLAGSASFVGRLRSPIVLRDTGLVRWNSARRLSIDLFAPLRGTLEPFDLLPERVYETRFLSRPVRRKDASRHETAPDPERAVIGERLAVAGWEPLALSVVKRAVRFAARPDNELTMWLGVLRWTGPESFVTDDEPFSFEDVREVPA